MINFGRAFKPSPCGCTPAGNGKEEPWHVVHCALHRDAPKILNSIRALLKTGELTRLEPKAKRYPFGRPR